MFGKNEIVGQKFFNEAAPDELMVTSRFFTLQGEGPYRGVPAFFVRLSKCQLACSFCDTWFDSGDWMTFDQIEDAIDTSISEYFENEVPGWAQKSEAGKKREMVLVLTGGEPMLQKNLVGFLYKMQNLFKYTQIESNGLLFQDIPDSTTLVVSPKCLEKDGKSIKYMKPHPKTLARADCLKFVMESNPDSPYSSVPDWAHEWMKETGRDIYCSPMNIYNREPQKAKSLRGDNQDVSIQERSAVDEKISFWEPGLLDYSALEANHKYTARYCIKSGFIFNMQMHLFADLA